MCMVMCGSLLSSRGIISWFFQHFRCYDVKLEMEYAEPSPVGDETGEMLPRRQRYRMPRNIFVHVLFGWWLTLELSCDIDELWLLRDRCLMINLGVLTNGKYMDAAASHGNRAHLLCFRLSSDGYQLLTPTSDYITIEIFSFRFEFLHRRFLLGSNHLNELQHVPNLDNFLPINALNLLKNSKSTT